MGVIDEGREKREKERGQIVGVIYEKEGEEWEKEREDGVLYIRRGGMKEKERDRQLMWRKVEENSVKGADRDEK